MPVRADDLQLTAPAPDPVTGISAQIVGPLGLMIYHYWWVAHYPIGVTIVSAPVTVRNAPDVSTLSATNYVTVSGQPAPGATTYDLLRTNSSRLPVTGPANIAVATGLTSPTFNDQGAALTAYNIAGLTAGAPVTGHIILNNRDFATPTLVMSPFSTAVQGLVFPDGSTQSTAAGASQTYNWQQDVQSNGHQLLGLTGLTINNPSAITTVAVQSGTTVTQLILSTTAIAASYAFIVNSGIFFFSDQSAPTPNNRIVIPQGNPGKIGLTTGASFTPTHLLQLNVDDAFKPTTNTWGITSDIRTKRNVKRLEGGMSVIAALEPIEGEYNGRADTPAGTRVVSFDPHELAKVLPDAVRTARGKLHPDDEEETDIAGVNIHEIIHHLVLAVQQLSEQIKALQRRRIGSPAKGIS